jgi:CheY-like chemotaxis protein
MGLAFVGGATLIRSLKATRQDAKVLAVSGMGDLARQMAVAAGADVFLAKPFSSAALQRALADLVGRQ